MFRLARIQISLKLTYIVSHCCKKNSSVQSDGGLLLAQPQESGKEEHWARLRVLL